MYRTMIEGGEIVVSVLYSVIFYYLGFAIVLIVNADGLESGGVQQNLK